MAQTAITYPQTTVTTMSGDTIKAVLEDVADNLFHPDPYYRQGGDMVRVGGLSFACAPGADRGDRIRDLRLGDEALAPGRRYKVAGWAPVSEGVSGPPVWEVVETYLRARSSLPVPLVNQPRLIGVAGNPGFSDAD
jgi:sulfur-oxidizing protein SoxB